MSAPKSVVKIKSKQGKNTVEYVSNVDAANYYLFELTRAALRDVGKFVKKTFQTEFYNHFHKITGAAGKVTKYTVFSSKNTKFPRLDIGLPHASKGNSVDGFYAYFQEFGSSKTPKLGLLTHAVQDNVAEIIKIESQYLSNLSGEAERLEALIENDAEDIDDNEI